MKIKLKRIVDIIMIALLPVLMTFQMTGQMWHEWLGAAMLILFVAHNILNVKWYKGFFTGKYTLIRILHTVGNILLLISMLCIAYSGITMSGYAFSFLPRRTGIASARLIHLAASYWGFVLMSIHVGFHWGIIASKICGKLKDNKKYLIWIFRAIAIVIAIYGAVCFYKNNIGSYMLLKNQFAFLNYEKSAVIVLAEFIAMIEFWVFIAYYLIKLSKVQYKLIGVK